MAVYAPLARPLRARFYELGLLSDDPARLAGFYESALGFAFHQDGRRWAGTARDRRLTISPGPSRKLGFAAYAVEDATELKALEQRLNAAGAYVERVDLPGLEAGAVSLEDPDGNVFVFGMPHAGAGGPLQGAGDRPARLQHLVVASRNLERMLTFFLDVVGFELSDRVVDHEGGLRTAFLRCSDEHHSLAVFAANEDRLDHHCYEAAEWNLIRDWGDHFAKQRIAVKWGPGRHGPGDNLFLFIHDCDGNWVEISAELERVAPDRPVGEWPHEEYTLNTWGAGLLRS